MISQWPKIKASIIQDVGNSFPGIDNPQGLALEQALETLKSLVEKQVPLDKVEGLTGTLMVSLHDSFCERVERGRQHTAIKELTTSFEPFLKKVLFITAPDCYAKLNEDPSKPAMLIKYLVALDLIKRSDFLDENNCASYQGRSDCLGHLCRTYLVRNAVHNSMDWNQREMAEISCSAILSYLYVILKFYDRITFGLYDFSFLQKLVDQAPPRKGFIELGACAVDLDHEFSVRTASPRQTAIQPLAPALELCRSVKRAVLTAPPGGGKTTLLRRLAGEDARVVLEQRSIAHPVPVYLDLSGYSEGISLMHMLQQATRLPEAEIAALLEKRDVRLYIDGLDDILDPTLLSLSAKAIREIKSLLAASPQLSLALTCRERNYRQYLGSLPVLNIGPLPDDQLRALVLGSPLMDPEATLSFLHDNPKLYELCKVPEFLNLFLSGPAYRGRLHEQDEEGVMNLLLGQKFKAEKDRFPMAAKEEFLAHFEPSVAPSTSPAAPMPQTAPCVVAGDEMPLTGPRDHAASAASLAPRAAESPEVPSAPPFISVETTMEEAFTAPIKETTAPSTWLNHMEDFGELARSYKLFADTCSFMFPCAEIFFLEKLKPALMAANAKLIVTSKVVEELQKHAKSSNPEKKVKAKAGLSIIDRYTKLDILAYKGEDGDPFADNVFQFVFSKFLTKHNLALITQDNALAADLIRLNSLGSVQSTYQVRVLRINSRSNLTYFPLETNDPIAGHRNKRQRPPIKEHPVSSPGRSSALHQTVQMRQHTSNDGEEAAQRAQANKPRPVRKFKVGTQPVLDSGKPLSASYLPTLDQEVLTEKYGALRLVKKISEGGEGAIYLTDNDLVCKVYFNKSLTLAKEQKLKVMLANPVDVPGICWPLDVARNTRQEFVGYVMPKAEGKPMQTCMFIKPILLKHFPHWTRKELAQTVISVLERIKALHDRNIIIGDINPLNFLIKSENEVYLVDTDSYQVEDYPCPVGTVNFTPPERQGMDYKTFLRTAEDEYFAVATLVFMMLLPGMPPYSQQGGGTPAENIKNQDFSYPLGEESNKKAPEGTWRFIWSHFPRKMKEDFHGTFRKNVRFSTQKWITMMHFYVNELQKGRSNPELFPTGLKIIDPVTSICSQCGAEFEGSDSYLKSLELHGRGGRCRPCIKAQNEEKFIRNYARKMVRLTGQGKSPASSRKTPGQTLQSSNQQTRSYPSQPPSRPAPRAQRTYPQAANYQPPNNTNASRQPQSSAPSLVPPTMPPPPKKKKGCFISTAALQTRGNSAEWRELDELRSFRDGWLSGQFEGEALIDRYYEVAPEIVAVLDTLPDKMAIYDEIWNAFLQPCLESIRRNEPHRAMVLYRAMVLDLFELVPNQGDSKCN